MPRARNTEEAWRLEEAPKGEERRAEMNRGLDYTGPHLPQQIFLKAP